jgi:micrococcal nuclease
MAIRGRDMGLFRILVRLFSIRVGSPSPPMRREPRVIVPHRTPPPQAHTVLRGRCWVIDGDTIVIDNVRLRLAGIDAPELDHP